MYHDLTKRFNDLLKLKQSPVGLAFVDDVPVEVSHTIPGSEFAMLVERLETLLQPMLHSRHFISSRKRVLAHK